MSQGIRSTEASQRLQPTDTQPLIAQQGGTAKKSFSIMGMVQSALRYIPSAISGPVGRRQIYGKLSFEGYRHWCSLLPVSYRGRSSGNKRANQSYQQHLQKVVQIARPACLQAGNSRFSECCNTTSSCYANKGARRTATLSQESS